MALQHVSAITILVHDSLILKDKQKDFVARYLLTHYLRIKDLRGTDIELVKSSTIDTMGLDLKLVLKLAIA